MTDDEGFSTLELADLLRGITKLSSEDRGSFQSIPVGLRDQVTAAVAEATAASGACSAADVPDWIFLPAVDALHAFIGDQVRTCEHNPSLRHSPMPVTAVAWKPGLVVCDDCQHLLRAKTVDWALCGQHAGDGGRVLTIGPLTYRVGVCNDCTDESTQGGPS